MPDSPPSKIRVIHFGDYEADFRAGELRKQGARIKIQEQPLQILALSLKHPGQVVTREELRARLWLSDTFVDFDHSLNKAVNKLREALGSVGSVCDNERVGPKLGPLTPEYRTKQ